VQLTAKCSSWPKFVELFTGDISAGGLFIPTDEAAAVGETVSVDITLPDEGTFSVEGTVVNIIGAERASQLGKRPGLGVKLDPLEGDAKARFDQLLVAARQDAPVPEESTRNGEPPAGTVDRSQQPTEDSVALRMSSVHQVLSEREVAEGAEPPLPRPVAQAMPPAAPGAKRAVTFSEPSDLAPPVQAPPRPAPGSGPRTIVGIDLGTTYSSIGAVVGKKVSILSWPDGKKSSPSVLSWPSRTELLVGSEAREKLATDPPHTIYSPKRLLGRKYDDREIQGFLGSAPYRTLAGPDGSVVAEIWGQQYAVPQLVSYILQEARKVAEAQLGGIVDRCVMTVPVSFDEARADLLRRAGRMAGLEVVALIDEPSAAALANRFDPNFGGVVGVYDFGGGTFDFSVVDVSRGDFQVMATAGDTWLGGDDFDAVVSEATANQFWRMHKVDLRKQAVEWQKLNFACERAKRLLSLEPSAAIYVPGVLRTADGMVDLNISIDRPTFERASSAIIRRSLATCDEALSLLDMRPTDLTCVYLSGGTTYIPAVREALARHFAVPVRTGVPPEHAVCLGAAIHAAQIQYQSAVTLDERD